MNRFKKKKKEEKPKKNRKVAKSIIGVLSGKFLTKEEVVNHLPYFLFIAFLALVYIANGYLAEENVRELNKLNKEVKELRSEYITTKSKLMYKSKQSQVATTIKRKGIGLKESMIPPKKITVKNDQIN